MGFNHWTPLVRVSCRFCASHGRYLTTPQAARRPDAEQEAAGEHMLTDLFADDDADHASPLVSVCLSTRIVHLRRQ